MRLYTRGATGDPLKTIDVSSGIGLSSGDEADFEDAARIGNRVYVISSHGRTKSGVIESARYHFFAMDVGGTSPNVTLTGPRLHDQAAGADAGRGQLDDAQHRRARHAGRGLEPRARRPTRTWRRWRTAPTSRVSPGHPRRRGRTSS